MYKFIAAVATVAVCALAGILPASAAESRVVGLGEVEVGKVEGVLPPAPAFLVALTTAMVVKVADEVLCTETTGIVEIVKGSKHFIYGDLDNGAESSKCFYYEDVISIMR